MADILGLEFLTYDATDLIWSFFQQYTLECSTLSISNDVIGKNKISFIQIQHRISDPKRNKLLTDVSYIHLLDNKGTLLKKSGINETQLDHLHSLPESIFLK